MPRKDKSRSSRRRHRHNNDDKGKDKREYIAKAKDMIAKDKEINVELPFSLPEMHGLSQSDMEKLQEEVIERSIRIKLLQSLPQEETEKLRLEMEARSRKMVENRQESEKRRQESRQEKLREFDGKRIHRGVDVNRNSGRITFVSYTFDQESGMLRAGHSNFRYDLNDQTMTKERIKQMIQIPAGDEEFRNSHWCTSDGRLEKRTFIFSVNVRRVPRGEEQSKHPRKNQIRRFRDWVLSIFDVHQWEKDLVRISISKIRFANQKYKDMERTPLSTPLQSEAGVEDEEEDSLMAVFRRQMDAGAFDEREEEAKLRSQPLTVHV